MSVAAGLSAPISLLSAFTEGRHFIQFWYIFKHPKVWDFKLSWVRFFLFITAIFTWQKTASSAVSVAADLSWSNYQQFVCSAIIIIVNSAQKPTFLLRLDFSNKMAVEVPETVLLPTVPTDLGLFDIELDHGIKEHAEVTICCDCGSGPVAVGVQCPSCGHHFCAACPREDVKDVRHELVNLWLESWRQEASCSETIQTLQF